MNRTAIVKALVVAAGGVLAWGTLGWAAEFVPPGPSEDTAIRSSLGGEAFQTSLFTGAATTSVPIAVPPGTNGMQPKLALVYDSSSRSEDDGFLGAGWSLSGLGYIERSSKFGVPRYPTDPTQENYILNLTGGMHDLVYVSSDGRYHTKEETFLRVQYTAGTDSWLVTDKSGIQYSFGGTADSKTPAVGRSATRRWSLNLVEDRHGNQLRVGYVNNPKDLATNTIDTGAVYPDYLSYTEGNGLATFRRVEFVYDTQPRPDVTTLYRSASPVMIDRRLARIDVKMGGAMVRRYELTYQPSGDASESLLTQVQEFGADATPGVLGTGTSLPPVTFDYSDGTNTFSDTPTEPWATQLADTFTISGVSGEFVAGYVTDLTGDGRADLVTCQSGSWYVAVSTGSGMTTSSSPWLTSMACSTPVVSLGDFNGDGKGDMAFVTAAGQLKIYTAQTSSLTLGWSLDYPAAIIFGRFGDFTGDGKTDFAIAFENAASACATLPGGWAGPENCDVWQVYRSTGSGFTNAGFWFWYSSDRTVPWAMVGDYDGNGRSDLIMDFTGDRNKLWVSASTGTAATFPAPGNGGFWNWNTGYWLDPHPTDSGGAAIPIERWDFGDFNGDGLTDVLTADPNLTIVTVYLSKGSIVSLAGFLAAETWFSSAGSWCSPVSDCLDHNLLQTGDANGDGKIDLMVVNTQTSGNWYWQVRLSSGRRFDAPGSGNWRALPSSQTMADFGCNIEVFDDFTGDGKIDLLRYHARMTSTCLSNNGETYVFPSSGSPVDLLTAIGNGLGGTTTLDYRSSGASNTCATNITGLAVKIYTLCSSTQNNGMQPFGVGWQETTQYAYQGQQYNATAREFRGFSQATVTDPTGTYTRTVFSQTDQLRGKPTSTETFSASATSLRRTVNTWGATTASNVVTVRLNQTDTYTEGGASAKQAQTRYGYDTYNNVIRVESLGDASITTDDRYDYTDYFYNTNVWLLDRPTHTYTRASSTGPNLTETWNYYDGQTSFTTGITTVLTVGDLTRVCQWLNTGSNPCTSFGYHPTFGTRTSVTDAKNNPPSLTEYDTTYQTFPVTETNALGHQVTTTYWGLPGVPISPISGAYAVPGLPATVTDPNGVRSDSYWDALGRSKATVVPPDTAGSPTTMTTYDVDGIAPEKTVVQKRERVNAGTIDSTTFVDGLGRTIQTRSEAPDGSGQVVVDTTYNSRGLVDTVSVPYTAGASTPYPGPNGSARRSTTIYDALGRVIQVTNTDGTYSSRLYDRWTTTLTDPTGRKKVETRDAFGRLVRVEEYMGSDGRAPGIPSASYSLYAATTYTYDTLGRLTKTIDTDGLAGNIATMSYDTLGRKIGMHDPDMGDWSYEYDANGNLLKQVDGKAQTIAFTYDALNRIKTKTTTTSAPQPFDPVPVRVTAGGSHTCALLRDGTVRCWGANGDGQLGNGSFTSASTPVMVSGLSGVPAVTAGGSHTCALLGDGTVRCWGYNWYGQLGNGHLLESSSAPVVVSGLSGVAAVSTGGTHTCALLGDGTVRCWGENYGRLGNGTTINSTTPVVVSGLTGATAVLAGGSHTCALLGDGTVRCWGSNGFGQLGNGTTTSVSTPVAVSGLSGVTAVTAGASHTCALLGDGTVRCWGWNGAGQLGNGTTTNASTPVAVSGLSGVTAVTAGGSHTCALLGDGTVRCWGYNGYGQLGNGSFTSVSTPVTVSGLSGATAVTTGGNHTCALLGDGTVRCWGNNASGQLGNGSTTSASTPSTPVALPNPWGPTALSATDLPGDTGSALRLAWTPSRWPAATQQRVFRNTTAGGTYLLVTTISNNTTATYTDTGLASGTRYYYVVRASDGSFESPNSNEASAVPGGDAPGPAVNLVVTATSTTTVSLIWTAPTIGGSVASYEIERSVNNGPFLLRGTSTSTTFADSGLTSTTTYLYRVRAVSTAGLRSGYSNVDLATTIFFTPDDPLVAGVTFIKASHFSQLRDAVNAVRGAVGLSAVTWPEPLTGPVKASHLRELRENLSPALSALGLFVPGYTNPTLTPGSTVIKKAHIEELRNAVK